MRDQGSWSLSLGRWGGVHVRLHAVLLVFTAVTIYLSWRAAHEAALAQESRLDPSLIWLTALTLAVLVVSVLLHELGHLYAAARLGCTMDEIVLGPLGGLAPPRAAHDAQAEIAVYLAGPLVNLFLCVASAPLLFIQPETDIVGLLNLLHPRGVGAGPWSADAVKLVFWVNWVLFCVNFIPAFPFDGGRALRAAILAVRPTIGRQFATMVVVRLAKFAALALILGAWLVREGNPGGVAPAWFVFVLLGIFLFFSAKQEERKSEEWDDISHLGYDYPSAPYGHFDAGHEPVESHVGFLGRWLERRRESKLRLQRESDARDEMLMDEVLDRVHKYGLNSLSEEERALLHRVSQRYRGRLGNGA
jgi:Zn-dependent protease